MTRHEVKQGMDFASSVCSSQLTHGQVPVMVRVRLRARRYICLAHWPHHSFYGRDRVRLAGLSAMIRTAPMSVYCTRPTSLLWLVWLWCGPLSILAFLLLVKLGGQFLSFSYDFVLTPVSPPPPSNLAFLVLVKLGGQFPSFS